MPIHVRVYAPLTDSFPQAALEALGARDRLGIDVVLVYGGRNYKVDHHATSSSLEIAYERENAPPKGHP